MFLRTSISALAAGALLALAVSMPGAGNALAARPQAGCVTGGYSTAASKCVTVPDSGSFSIKIPHGHTVLVGTGTADTAGTKIHVVAVASPPGTSGIAIRITASGPFPPLHAKKGKLSSYTAKTGKVKGIKKVTKPGIYVLKV